MEAIYYANEFHEFSSQFGCIFVVMRYAAMCVSMTIELHSVSFTCVGYKDVYVSGHSKVFFSLFILRWSINLLMRNFSFFFFVKLIVWQYVCVRWRSSSAMRRIFYLTWHSTIQVCAIRYIYYWCVCTMSVYAPFHIWCDESAQFKDDNKPFALNSRTVRRQCKLI